MPAPASGASMNNRPLPEPPRPAPSEGGGSSRSGTPKSVFDTIQRPPSVQLERIKTKASATLDRMAQLQQRYRQQKASQLELNTSGSEQVSSRVWVLTRSQTCLSFPTSMYIVSFRLSHFVLVFPFSLALALSLFLCICHAAAFGERRQLRALVKHFTIALAFSFRQHVIWFEFFAF